MIPIVTIAQMRERGYGTTISSCSCADMKYRGGSHYDPILKDRVCKHIFWYRVAFWQNDAFTDYSKYKLELAVYKDELSAAIERLQFLEVDYDGRSDDTGVSSSTNSPALNGAGFTAGDSARKQTACAVVGEAT